MATTLQEGFSYILREVRRLNQDADAIAAELGANGSVPEKKLRRLLTLNADAYDTILQYQTLSGLATYASDQLGGLNMGVVASLTKTAMTTFRDFMIANLPAPSNNALDVNGRTVLGNVSTADMPTLLAELTSLATETAWA